MNTFHKMRLLQLLFFTLLLAGFLFGFILAPIQKGLSFKWALFSHNGKHNGNHNGNDNYTKGEIKDPKKKKGN